MRASRLLVLSKEQFLLLPVGVAAWELTRHRKRLRNVAFLGAAAVPAAAWWIYARVQLGAWFTSGGTALARALRRLEARLLDAGIQTYTLNGRENVGAEAAVVVLAALLAILGLTALLALRRRTPVDAIYVLLVALAVCLAAECNDASARCAAKHASSSRWCRSSSRPFRYLPRCRHTTTNVIP